MTFSFSQVRIGLIPGDGIGQEVIPAAATVLDTLLGKRLRTTTLDAGFGTFERTGTALPEATCEQLANCDGALLGAVGSPVHRAEGYRSPVVELRRRFGLFANLRPLRSLDETIDLLIVRENTEGLYSGREHQPDEDSAITERVITRAATEKVAHKAFQLARERAAKRDNNKALVTIVHKANVLRIGDGLFRQVAFEVAKQYPDIEVGEQLVDSMAYRMIVEPEKFDVLVTPNLYGDIISDAGAALVGGLGIVPSANRGDDFCVAEPVHGSAPDIAGLGKANPLATFLAAELLLKELGEMEPASRLARAIDTVRRTGPKTFDQGGSSSTQEVTEAICSALLSPKAPY